jgi:predicted HicB family RNase H-like nuclease
MTTDTRKRFTLRLPKAVYDTLLIQAKDMGIPINSYVIKILWDWYIKAPMDSTMKDKEV